MIIAQINNNFHPSKKEVTQLGTDLALIAVDEYFVKDLLDILCDNKGNHIVKKLLLRISQQIDKFVEVEDNNELDEATYQQLKGNIEKVFRLANSGLLLEPSAAQFEEAKQSMRNVSKDEIGAATEIMRKFLLKVLDDPEIDKYLQEIPAAWRPESKLLAKSCVNLLFGLFERDLIYDIIPFALDAAEGKEVKEQEIFSLISKYLKK